MKMSIIISLKVVLIQIMVFYLFIGLCSAQDEIIRLKQGNERFVSGQLTVKNFLELRPELVKGQEPYAIIVTCADSRVPPEYIFDETLGELFVIRVAGNVVDPDVLGSIEYAIEHLHTHLLVILGHTKCGAVTAALQGGKVPPNIGAILYKIKPAVKIAKNEKVNEEETLNIAIRENSKIQIKESLKQSKIIKEAYEKGELKIFSGLYNLESGKVEFEEFSEK